MALVTMASTEEAIDALIVSFDKQFPHQYYCHFYLNFTLRLLCHKHANLFISLIPTENAQLQNHRIKPPQSIICQDEDILSNIIE